MNGLDILDGRDTIKISKFKIDSKVIKSHLANTLWKHPILYQLNLILNYNQGLAPFRKKKTDP